MPSPVLPAVAAATTVFVVLPAAVCGLVLTAAADAVAGGGCGGDGGPGGGSQRLAGQQFSAEQMSNARTLTSTAVALHLPRRAAVLATATGIVESGLRNLDYGDRDSLGILQQRPSQGWGSAEQILNPAYAARAFYRHLTTIPHWDTLPPGDAEQAVQRSAFPERYAPQEAPAAALVATFWTGPDHPASRPSTGGAAAQAALTTGGCADQGAGNTPLDPQTLPAGFTLPTDPRPRAAVTYALAQLGKPYVWGAKGPDAFDCSGLTQAAWAHAGYGISAGTTSQVHDGTPVAGLDALHPGDLVFIPGSLGTAAVPRHVGLYAGHGLIVNAYDEHHGVILETLHAWAPKIVAIRRITTPSCRFPMIFASFPGMLRRCCVSARSTGKRRRVGGRVGSRSGRVSAMSETLSMRTIVTGVSSAEPVVVRYRCRDGRFVDTVLSRLPVVEVLSGLPVREFRAWRGRRHYSGWYWSVTTGGHVVYESRLELARILLADHDRDVVAILAQPFVLEGADGDRVRRHVPDLLLGRADGEVVVVDVKPAGRLGDPDVVAQFAWMRRVCERHGLGFEVWSGADPVLLANVRFLAGYRRPETIAMDVAPVVMDAAASPVRIGELEGRLLRSFALSIVRPVILHLLWRSQLRTDLSRPVDGDAVVVSGVLA